MKRELIDKGSTLLSKIGSLNNMLYSFENEVNCEMSFYEPTNSNQCSIHYPTKTLTDRFKDIVYEERDRLEKELEDL